MSKLQQLIEQCKSSVHVTANQHRAYYQSVRDYVDGWGNGEMPNETDATVLAEMIARDTVIEVQFYPVTAIGFYVLFHYDLHAALDMALQTMSELKAEGRL